MAKETRQVIESYGRAIEIGGIGIRLSLVVSNVKARKFVEADQDYPCVYCGRGTCNQLKVVEVPGVLLSVCSGCRTGITNLEVSNSSE